MSVQYELRFTWRRIVTRFPHFFNLICFFLGYENRIASYKSTFQIIYMIFPLS